VPDGFVVRHPIDDEVAVILHDQSEARVARFQEMVLKR
jgi:hypothetical protein